MFRTIWAACFHPSELHRIIRKVGFIRLMVSISFVQLVTRFLRSFWADDNIIGILNQNPEIRKQIPREAFEMLERALGSMSSSYWAVIIAPGSAFIFSLLFGLWCRVWFPPSPNIGYLAYSRLYLAALCSNLWTSIPWIGWFLSPVINFYALWNGVTAYSGVRKTSALFVLTLPGLVIPMLLVFVFYMAMLR